MEPDTQSTSSTGTGDIGLHNLKPADGSRKDRKRIGRGHGSGHGKTSGRGHKGAGARTGSKRRGPNKKMSMPFEPFRTHTQHVNLDDLARRFDDGAAVDLAALKRTGLATKRDVPVKILGRGELDKKLTVHAHKFSKTARERIESAGGTCQLIES